MITARKTASCKLEATALLAQVRDLELDVGPLRFKLLETLLCFVGVASVFQQELVQHPRGFVVRVGFNVHHQSVHTAITKQHTLAAVYLYLGGVAPWRVRKVL